MKNKIINTSLSLLLLISSNIHAESWVDVSNSYTNKQIQLASEFQPEYASFMGITASDGKCLNITKEQTKKYLHALKQGKASLENAVKKEEQLPVRQDISILINSIDLELADYQLDEKYLLPWIDVPNIIFDGLSGLLDDQMSVSRKVAAVERLACYIGKTNALPLTEQAKVLFHSAEKNKSLIGPIKDKIEQALSRTDAFIDGLNKLFEKNNLTQAKPSLIILEKQLKDYVTWVKTNVIPKTRKNYRLPAEIYALNLKKIGIDISPELLIERAKASYMITKANMQAIAPIVAKKYNLKTNDYREVIKALKTESLSNEVIESHYRNINTKLEDIITKQKIVNLPKRDMIMRLATDAEAAGSPAPHMRPPPFIGNTGERGQFILTTGNPSLKGDAAYDDFNFNAVAYTLSAHEGRPGHELQFTAMLEQGVSLARVYYAFNSVNVEGWALYAEAEILPYLPIEGQLIALQHRLLRNARAMLDPMLNLGLTTKDNTYKLLINEVGFSKAAAKQEVDRYTMRSPGQAGSYFYGLSRLLEIRAEIEIALGEQFDRLAFNNFVLSQGLISPKLMAEAIKDQFLSK